MTVESSDSAFRGSIPALYDRCLGPFLFEPYAQDLAARAAALSPRRILETAAGTGIVTAALAAALPDAEIVATDLNPDMLAVAHARIASPRIAFRPADAMALPFPDRGFDLVVCQFGAMFFPDRPAAFAEARRVLRPGGTFLLNVWDRIEANPASAAVAEAVAGLFPEAPPSFLARTPFGYHDVARLSADLAAAGFADVAVETVARRSRGRASDVAPGLCEGSPLRAEIESHGPGRLAEATSAALARLREVAGGDSVDLPMSAHVATARA
ncbi:MAG: methyltransferase domain-containing protein [Alphaproteobacteria bacterium]|nr:methyltransferase domain-containing protein [Alphaproteobacteria bacterium]MBV9372009.1 methyltransferase domain-containing protein [Alphaproteobacteria bacterium]MBV9901717.1 methyltransferase domain-containing protein [Alphaproteobacteria bacterium]